MKDQIELTTLVQYFDEAEDATSEARATSERCRDYYDGAQLTAGEKTALKSRGQPEVVINMIARNIDTLKGLESQTRTDPKAYPRTPDSDKAADAATDGIRYVLDNNDFDTRASDQLEYMAVEGTGGVAVEAEQGKKGIDIKTRKLAWNRLFADPFSMERDYSDARYIGYISWKDQDDVERQWPEAKKELAAGMQLYQNAGETKDDKPTRWYSPTRKRIMCVDINFLHGGVWHQAIFAKGAWLEKPQPSAYINEDGEPECKFILASPKVDRDGRRYGIVKNSLDEQDEVNKRRSKSLHLLNTRQTFSREGAINNINAFKREANKPDGHLTYPGSGVFGKDFGIVPNESLVGPQFEMYLEAKNSIDMTGANLVEASASGLSGKAVRSLQQAGLLELAPLFDIQSQWKKRVYRAVWNRIRQYWKEEKWIRVTDNEENLKWVGLNVPMTIAEQQVVEVSGLTVQEVRKQYGDKLQQLYQVAPDQAEQVVENNVAELDVDIIIEEVPDVINLQSEQFELLVKMYQANPWSEQNPSGVKWEHVIAVSTLRNKDQILGKDKTPEDQEKEAQQNQLLQQNQEVQKAMMQIEAENKQSQTAVNQTKAEVQRAKAQQAEIESIILLNSPDPEPQMII